MEMRPALRTSVLGGLCPACVSRRALRFSRQRLSDWVEGAATLAQIVVARMKQCLLEGGYLQRDGYGVSGSIVAGRPDLAPVGCGAHIRRKFVDSLADDPEQSTWFIDHFREPPSK